MKNIIRNLNKVLDKKQKQQLMGLSVLILIGGILETLGFSLLGAAAAAVVNENSKYVKIIKNILHTNSKQTLLVTMFTILIVLFFVKNIFLIYLTHVQNHFIAENRNIMISNVLREFLNRPYEFYLDADIPTVFRITDSDIPQVFVLILTLTQIATEFVVALFLGISCLVVSFEMSVIMIVILVIISIVITKVLKPLLKKYGEKNLKVQSRIAKWRIEAIYGIKDVKVLHREEFFASNYESTGKVGVGIATKYAVLNGLPKMILEPAFIITLMLYLIIKIVSGADIAVIGGQLIILAAAASRLLPSASRINTYLATVAYCEPCLDYLAEHMDLEKLQIANARKKEVITAPALKLEECISLSNIMYKYPNTEKYIFEGASMKIPKGKSVGIMGTSGAGKSTVVDILLGLLHAEKGSIQIDSRDIFENYPSWLAQIGYIPQSIYLVDEPIRNNIAFGIADDEIDDSEIWRALEEAQLKEFVESLPEGLDTAIGDRGVRLSGGQRQRLGIARALYHNPEILVFDEATSALDNETEAALMEAINGFHGKKTMVIIAHRLNTIEKCDIIYKVDAGKIEETHL